MHSSFRGTLTYEYHDSWLERFELGPRRELILQIRLDPVWNPRAPEDVRLRFGGIQNFDEVRTFFDLLEPVSRGALNVVDEIARPEKGKWIVDLDRSGTVTIVTSKLPQEQ